jgi:hypothetical protein
LVLALLDRMSTLRHVGGFMGTGGGFMGKGGGFMVTRVGFMGTGGGFMGTWGGFTVSNNLGSRAMASTSV